MHSTRCDIPHGERVRLEFTQRVCRVWESGIPRILIHVRHNRYGTLSARLGVCLAAYCGAHCADRV